VLYLSIFQCYKDYKVLKSYKQRLKICNMRPTMWVRLASWHRPPRYCLGQSDATKKILSRLPQGLGILQGFCNWQNTTYIDIFPPTFYIIWYWVVLRNIVVMTVSNSLDRRPVEKLRFVDCFLRVWKQEVKKSTWWYLQHIFDLIYSRSNIQCPTSSTPRIFFVW
jgi:hypothetical protein